jgi:hypothetical protein
MRNIGHIAQEINYTQLHKAKEERKRLLNDQKEESNKEKQRKHHLNPKAHQRRTNDIKEGRHSLAR